MASSASSATTGGARKHAWTKILLTQHLGIFFSSDVALERSDLLDWRLELSFYFQIYPILRLKQICRIAGQWQSGTPGTVQCPGIKVENVNEQGMRHWRQRVWDIVDQGLLMVWDIVDYGVFMVWDIVDYGVLMVWDMPQSTIEDTYHGQN